VLTIVGVASFARLAYPQRSGLEMLILPVGLAVACTILFVMLLGIRLSVWPW
jgi:hypothetical protein